MATRCTQQPECLIVDKLMRGGLYYFDFTLTLTDVKIKPVYV